MIKRKRNRLESHCYIGERVYFVTTLTFARHRYFNNPKIVEFCLQALRETAKSDDWLVHAYCFMPDHLHLLIQATQPTHSLVSFMQRFKSTTGFWFKRIHCSRLWHKSFHDHVLRSEESIGDVAGYIFQNPVSDNLVQSWKEYPHLGSFTLPVEELITLES